MSTGAEPAAQLRALVLQNEISVQHLRAKAIPHHGGMSAACRALAVEVPRTLAQHIEEDLSNGSLAERWRAAKAATSEGTADDLEPPLAALAFLLRDQSRAVARHLLLRGKVWAAEIYRLEGQADALDAQNEQLRRLTEPTTVASQMGDADATEPGDIAPPSPPVGAER